MALSSLRQNEMALSIFKNCFVFGKKKSWTACSITKSDGENDENFLFDETILFP